MCYICAVIHIKKNNFNMGKINKNIEIEDGSQLDDFTEKQIEKQLGIKDSESYNYKQPIKKKKRKKSDDDFDN